MLGFSKKRFLITLGLSILIWYVTVIIQGIVGINAPFGILGSGNTCNLTGFPIAQCIYSSNSSSMLVWTINIINVIIWFWVIHFFWNLFSSKK